MSASVQVGVPGSEIQTRTVHGTGQFVSDLNVQKLIVMQDERGCSYLYVCCLFQDEGYKLETGAEQEKSIQVKFLLRILIKDQNLLTS